MTEQPTGHFKKLADILKDDPDFEKAIAKASAAEAKTPDSKDPAQGEIIKSKPAAPK